MTQFNRLVFCAFVASAWFGCDDTVLTDTAVQPTVTPGPPTPGGQTPYVNDAGPNFYEYLPPGYGTGSQFPLLIFLHGIGECGDGTLATLPLVLKHGPPKLIENGKVFPAIVISPQARKNAQGGCSWGNLMDSFVEDMLARHGANVDRARLYMTGLSLGGMGTWTYARSHPSTVAAIVPICGPKSGTGYDVLSGMPIWTFHKFGDGTVSIHNTADILEEITGVDPRIPEPFSDRAGSTGYFGPTAWDWIIGQSAPAAGKNPMFTIYTGASHDAWTAAYNNQAMWDWLFAQHLPHLPPPVPCSPSVFRQDFQSSTSVSSYVSGTPGDGQFNDISAEATGGTWSINQGRLQLVRTTSATSDNDAGITRSTDFPCAPAKLHVTFDVGVSGWTNSPFQSGAMIFTVGAMSGTSDYGNGEVTANSFHSITVKGEGAGQLSVVSAAAKSQPLAANGTIHRVALFLNKSGVAASYRAPDGSLRTLRNNGVALWVNGAAVVVDDAAANGSSSALTDLRIRWSTAVNGTWSLDNLSIDRNFPQ